MHKVMTGVTDDVPQWSPPLNGGSTIMVNAAQTQEIAPQWSPPPNGGSTTPGDVQFNRERHAAMEPAAERREHALLNGHIREIDPAAMEAAVGRQQDRHLTRLSA